jgi:hypothetical protein
MANINTALAASKDAIEQLIVAGEEAGPAWTAPGTPGKWSPSQIVEHVARSLEESAAFGNAAFLSTRLNRRPRTTGCTTAGSFGNLDGRPPSGCECGSSATAIDDAAPELGDRALCGEFGGGGEGASAPATACLTSCSRTHVLTSGSRYSA